MNSVDYIRTHPIAHFKKGELLLSAGDEITKLLAIREGYIKVCAISAAGVEQMIWVAGRYDILPTEQLFRRNCQATFFYTAITDGSFYEIKKAEFLSEVAKNSSLAIDIAQGMSDHYDDLMSRLHAIEMSGVNDKILLTLQYLARKFSADACVDLYQAGFMLTHRDIASMIGVARETVSAALVRLRTQGYISYSRAHFIVYTIKIDEKFN